MTLVKSPLLEHLDRLDDLDREDLLKFTKDLLQQGVTLNFSGKRAAQEIARKVRPRVLKQVKALHGGDPEQQHRNLLIEGENLQAMVTLYKYRGEIDLILTDPPYNTGQDFRYNDRWDTDPNDPELGLLVPKEDGSRHTKWMRFMLPRLYTMKDMLKEGGVIAICIDHNEFFHLGMMMDEVFGRENRLGIINWQKTYSAKNDSGYISTATEYVLVYAKEKKKVGTKLLARTEEMDARYTSPDGDPHAWTGGDLSAKAHPKPEDYGIQSPFTGEMHYPPNKTRWRIKQSDLKKELERWGSPYVYVDDPAGSLKSLVLKGSAVVDGQVVTPELVLAAARVKALEVRDTQIWPLVFFLSRGEGRPRYKRYLKNVKKGRIPMSYWADEDYTDPLAIDVQSWDHGESGHSDDAKKELNAILGPSHGFETVKPLMLMTKIMQLWCPPNGIVLDPFAGSGTTAHAALLLNAETDSHRRFILIEQGRPENGDKYARTLTCERLQRAITGLRPSKDGQLQVLAEPLGGGFEFKMLTQQIDAKTLLSMRRDELIDVVIGSHFEAGRRKTNSLIRIDDAKYKYLFGRDEQNEGYFLIWDGADAVGQLDETTYDTVLDESRKAGLKPPHHVYARYEIYQSNNVRFYQIPDRILAHLGFNEFSDAFNNEEAYEVSGA